VNVVGPPERRMAEPARDKTHHEQHRVLAIRGKSYCNSACVFCVEKFTTYHPVAPKVDETRQLILAGAGKYNMLFFMNGEPSVHPKLFDYVTLAKEQGYRFFGMSSHFRAFADPHFALRVLEAGFEFFDISLHAATFEAQAEVNPIGDVGRSLKEALHGLRNVQEIARRTGRRVAITHKIVISRLNYRDLLAIFRATYRFGVRNYILQPVKASGIDADLTARLSINEDEFMPHVNDLLRETEHSGAEIKLYGMSQIGAYQGEHLVQETNLIKHVFGKNSRLTPELKNGDRLIPAELVQSSAPNHRVTVHLPSMADSATFDCREDQFILNAALAGGVSLPFGCRMGSCGMCTGKLVEGSVDRADQLILTDEQMAEGFVLLCKSRPRSDLVIVTHQEIELGI
jgi:ferredoxin